MRTHWPMLGATLLLVALFTFVPEAAEAQSYYSDCDECAARLGGRRTAGPYDNLAQCRQYVSQMRAQGFPFGCCYTPGCGCASGSQLPGDGGTMTLAQAAFTLGLGGALIAGMLTYATSPPETAEEDALIAAAQGAGAGIALAIVMDMVMSSDFRVGGPFDLGKGRLWVLPAPVFGGPNGASFGAVGRLRW